MTSLYGLHRAKCVGRRSTRLVALKAVVALLLLMAPPLPSAEALKLSSTKDDRENLGMGLLRAVEVVRGRFERAWALVSAPEPSPADLDTALELLQANAKQWESLEPAVTLWAERENAEAAASTTKMDGFEAQERVGQHQEQRARGKSRSLTLDATRPSDDNHGLESGEGMGQHSSPETASRIYEEAASLLAHNRAVLGQALARSGHMDLGIKHLEIACPEILEYQQNAQGHRNSKSWLDCYANLVQMYKTQKRFDEAAELLAKMPWLPVQDEVTSSFSSRTSNPASSSRGDGSISELDKTEAVGAERCGEAGTDLSVSDAAGVVSSNEVVSVREVAASRGGSNGGDNGGDSGPQVDPTGDADLHGTGSDTNDEHQASGGVEVPVGQSASSVSSKAAKGEEEKDLGSLEEGVVGNGHESSCNGCNTGRSDASPPHGVVAARAAGLSKPASGGSSSASMESSMTSSAGEVGSESHTRESVEVHAEAMRALMNEVAGELAVSTATRSTMGEEWLAARVGDAEAILASVRAGLLPASSSSPEAGAGSGADQAATGVSPLAVSVPGHADIVREASHYLSAIKGVAAQGWSYVDNEIQRMERHPGPSAKPGFQSRREVIHTFRYLLMKARQFASENQSHVPGTPPADSKWPRGTGRKSRPTSGKPKDSKARKPKKGNSPGRSKTSRKEEDHPEGDNYGLHTLLVGAFLAVLATVFSSGRSGGAGRRRDAVRQRAATRAARTAGSYVEPSQRGLLMSLALKSCSNLRRSWVVVSIRVRSNASVVRSTLMTVGMGLFMRLRSALDLHLLSYGIRVIGNLGRSAEREAGRSTAGSRKGGNSTAPLQRQRSRKHVKKALAQEVTRRRTETGSRSASPCELAGKATTTSQAAADADAARSGLCRRGVEGQEIRETANGVRGGILAEPSKSKPMDSKSNSGDLEVQTEMLVHTAALRTTGRGAEVVGEQEISAVGAVRMAPMSGSWIDDVREAEVSNFSKVAMAAAAALAGTPSLDGSVVSLPSTITVDQVKAIVEEDELAWEQAKRADRGQHGSYQRTGRNDTALPSSDFSGKTTISSPLRKATLARQTLSACSGKGDDGCGGTRAEMKGMKKMSPEQEGGWSEVVSGGSRWRTHGGGSGPGNRGGGGPALLSMRYVRAATRPARSSSPGSDPATTTSASSSDCSDVSKEHMKRSEPPRGACQRNGSKQHQQTLQVRKANDGASPHVMKHLPTTWSTSSVSRMKGVSGGSSRASKPQSEQGRGPHASRVQKWSSDTKISRPSRSAQAAWPDGNSTGPLAYMRSPRVGRNGRLSSSHSSHRTAAAGTGVRADGRLAGGYSGASVHETPKGVPRAGGNRPGQSLPVVPSAVQTGQKRTPDAFEQPRVDDGETMAPSACPRPGPAKPVIAVYRDPARKAADDDTEGADLVGGDGTDLCEDSVCGASSSSSWAVTSVGGSYDKQPPEDEVCEKAQENKAHESGELFEGLSPTSTGDDNGADAPTPMGSRAPEGDFSQAAETHPHLSPLTCAAVNDCHTGSIHPGGDSMSSMVYHQPMLVSGMSSMTAPVSDADDEVMANGAYGRVPDVSYEGSQDSVGSAGAHPGERDRFSPEFTPALAPPVPQPPHLLVLAPARSHDQYPPLAGVPPPQHQQQPPPIQDPTGMPAMYCHMPHQPAPAQGVYYPGPAIIGGGMGLMSRGINSGGLEPVLGALCWQVEYYFSVENLMRDVYLRSLMDSEGFVDVSKIMVFNRVRKMTSEISVLVAALRRSSRLEVREQEHTGEEQVRTRHSPLHWISTQAVLPPPPAGSSDEPTLDDQGFGVHTVASAGCVPFEQRAEDVVAVEGAELSGEYGVVQSDAVYGDERQRPIAFEAQGQGIESPQSQMVTAG